MQEGGAQTRGQLIGRELELAEIGGFIAGTGRPRALLITGEAGIGKTTIWEQAVALTRTSGSLLLAARPSDAEAQLSFATLGDLLHDVTASDLRDLPSPQRHAVEVALLRADPDGSAPEQRAIALGVLGVLEHLAARRSVTIAIDDVQWVDAASREVLAFVVRRLGETPVRFLLAHRSGTTAGLLRAFEDDDIESIEVNAFSLGALRRLLFDRLGLSLTRRALRRVYELAQGNPLFSLELGRSLAERGAAAGETIALPARVEEMLGTRVTSLPGPLRKLLVAVALCPSVNLEELRSIASVAELDDAVDAGLLVVEGDHARASHPLLAAAALRHSAARERRAVQLALAEVVGESRLRATLLAGATTRPDEAVAAAIAEAADGASRRGALVDAVVLAEHALRLTPATSATRSDRVLLFARLLSFAGERQRMVEFLDAEIESLPPGAATAEAFYVMASESLDPEQITHYVDRALAESPDDLGLRAACTGLTCLHGAVIRLLDVDGAEQRLRDVLPHAHLGRPELEQEVLLTLVWINALRGHAAAELATRFPEVSFEHVLDGPSSARTEGQRLVWRGSIDEARALFADLLGAGDELGELVYALSRLHLCELELRCGDWAAVERMLVEWEQSSEGELLIMPTYERCRALLAAGRGEPDEVERWARQAISRTRESWGAWDELESLRALGISALLTGEPAQAAVSLRAVWDHVQREGIDEPGVFPVAPDLVEALVELGELDDATSVVARLRELSERLQHPWGLVTARRCGALVALASTQDDGARGELAGAAVAYGELGLRFDRARCLLALGRAERRQRKWGGARESLEQAAAAFEEIGSVGWAELARSELARVGARKPRPRGELTPTELRSAELAAQGLANKEIAATLHVSVHTVEVHLSRTYAKLGIRSRSQLVAALPRSEVPPNG